MEFKNLRKIKNYLEATSTKIEIEAALEQLEANINDGYYESLHDAVIGRHLTELLDTNHNSFSSPSKKITVLLSMGFDSKQVLSKLKENPQILTATDELELLKNFTGLDEKTCDKILTNANNAKNAILQEKQQANWANIAQQTVDATPAQLNLNFYEPQSIKEKLTYEIKKRSTEKKIEALIELIESGKADINDLRADMDGSLGIGLMLPGQIVGRTGTLAMPNNILLKILKENKENLALLQAQFETIRLNPSLTNEALNFFYQQFDTMNACLLLQCTPESLQNLQALDPANLNQTDYAIAFAQEMQAGLAAAQTQEKTAELQ